MSTTQFSIRLPNEQKVFLDNLAATTDRSRNQLVATAISKMMENYKFVTDMIERSDADLAAGRVVSMDEAERRAQIVIDKAFARQAQ
jgi:predicted transcriptional regulator